MIRFHTKGVQAIQKALVGAATGLICTPYYSERGLELLDPFFNSAETIEFWTRFSPLDWRSSVADMAALRRRVQSVLNRGKAFDFRVSDAVDVFAAYVDVAADAISKSSDGPAEEEFRKALVNTLPEAPRIEHIEIGQFIDC